MNEDDRCVNCGLPLFVLVEGGHVDGRCVDREACAERRKLGWAYGGTLLSPEGVTKFTVPEDEEP